MATSSPQTALGHPAPAIERLFGRHNLGPVRTVEPLSGGQLNWAVRVNAQYVLRWRESALATGSLRREAAVLERIQGRLPVPEAIASGLDDMLGEYLIERWVPGKTLLQAWLEIPDHATREWWLHQWTAAIRALHEERYPRPGSFEGGELKESPSWRTYIEGRLRKRLDGLMRAPSIDRQFILVAEKYVRRQAPVLEDGPFCLIHRDLHFGNALVDGPHLTALLDFELAEVGPPDYELDTIYRFLRYPSYFVPPDQARGVIPARFASVWMRLRRGCPEIFAARHLRERLCLYALDRDLSTLQQVHNGRFRGGMAESEARRDAALQRIGEILQGRYGPE